MARGPDSSGDSLSAQYGLALAPGGLFVAQELLNSGLPAAPERDPLHTLEATSAWLSATLREWAARTGQAPPTLSVDEADLPRLRRARERLRAWLAGEAPPGAHARVQLGLGADRRVSYAPGGSGAAGLEALVAVELLLAERTGTAARLKVCANPDCGAAFYDGSPNSSRRWHDVRTCGNVANLRASRARRTTARTAG